MRSNDDGYPDFLVNIKKGREQICARVQRRKEHDRHRAKRYRNRMMEKAEYRIRAAQKIYLMRISKVAALSRNFRDIEWTDWVEKLEVYPMENAMLDGKKMAI